MVFREPVRQDDAVVMVPKPLLEFVDRLDFPLRLSLGLGVKKLEQVKG